MKQQLSGLKIPNSEERIANPFQRQHCTSSPAWGFFDDFSFNDNLIDFGPIKYSQPLGCWHPEIDKPKIPHYTKIHIQDGSTVCLQNKDYIELKKLLSNVLPSSCNDFYIYSELKNFSDEFIQKDIVIF